MTCNAGYHAGYFAQTAAIRRDGPVGDRGEAGTVGTPTTITCRYTDVEKQIERNGTLIAITLEATVAPDTTVALGDVFLPSDRSEEFTVQDIRRLRTDLGATVDALRLLLG
jgi:hypothetical protein